MPTVAVDKILDWFWSHLDRRQKDILAGRFGLEGEGPNTLAELGEKYNITRERVRQIEAGALNTLKEKAPLHPAFGEFVERNKKYLKNAGGVARKFHVLGHHADFIKDLNENHLDLFTEASGAFEFYPEDDDFWPFYYLDEKCLESAKRFVNEWEKFLRARKEEILSEQRYPVHFKVFVKKMSVNPAHAENYVAISKIFHTNCYGDTGLAEWPEIKPVTIRDHVYLVLKKEKEPVHFSDIAKLISERNEGRNALCATVHNELIKDKRFVLVGRGIYGLAEHGYQPGTAREVIQRILKESGPMRTKELVSAVQKERFFKPNTILVNLQNKKYFFRQPDSTYVVRRK